MPGVLAYAWGPEGVLGGWVLSHGRGNPVGVNVVLEVGNFCKGLE